MQTVLAQVGQETTAEGITCAHRVDDRNFGNFEFNAGSAGDHPDRIGPVSEKHHSARPGLQLRGGDEWINTSLFAVACSFNCSSA